MVRALFSLLAAVPPLLFAVAATPVHANSAFTYSIQQNDIYEIVVADAKTGTELKPGIYRIDKKTGDNIPVLFGDVMGVNRAYKGILAYAPRIADANSNHDALTILDGRVVLFNANTSPKSPSSYLELGGQGPSALRAFDVIHGTEVRIPEITSLDDVVLQRAFTIAPQGKFSSGGRFYLLSMRAPSPLGTGLTLGFIVEADQARGHKITVTGDKAWVLGYDFMDAKMLDRLLTAQTKQLDGSTSMSGGLKIELHAPSILTKFKNQLSRIVDSTGFVRAWLDQITRFQNYQKIGLKQLGESVTAQDLQMGIPSFDFIAGTENLPTAPFDPVMASQKVIGVSIDPVHGTSALLQLEKGSVRTIRVGRRELRYANAKDVRNGVIASRSVDRDPKSGKYLIFAEPAEAPESPDEDAFLYFSNGGLYLTARNNRDASHAFQTIPVQIPQFSPTDQIAFKRKRVEVNGTSSQVLLILRKSERSNKSEIFAFVVNEGHTLTSAFPPVRIYQGPAMSFKEMAYRLVDDGADLLFDNVTPVRGAAAYLKPDDSDFDKSSAEVPRKTVPYLRLMSLTQGGGLQKYLRALSENVVVQDYVYFREYNSAGSERPATGFYLKGASEEAKAKPEVFVAGRPLYARNGRSSDHKINVMQSKMLYDLTAGSARAPAINLSLIPYTDESSSKDKEASRFQMLMAFTANGASRSGHPIDGAMLSATIGLPYKSLAFTQILPGFKGHANEFHVLLFFRADEKIKGSVDGVWAATGQIEWKNGGTEKFEVNLSQFARVHKGPVAPGTVKAHLLVDAEGRFYWLDDPAADHSSTKYRVHPLNQPSEVVSPRQGQILQLREPDHLKETEVGFTLGNSRFGGRWEIFSEYSLNQAVPGLSEFLDKKAIRSDKKKAAAAKPEAGEKDEEVVEETNTAKPESSGETALLEAFGRYLDELAAHPGDFRRPKIFVVDQALKDKFKWELFSKLASDRGSFSLKNPSFNYYHANASLDDVEVGEELQFIMNQSATKSRALYVDSKLLEEIKIPARANGGEEGGEATSGEKAETAVFDPAEADAQADMLVLLASDGRAKSLKGFRKLKPRDRHLPMLSIVTPDEWRSVQEEHSRDLAAGVFDNFEMNYDFLTSSWTVWPPRADKAADDMKNLSRAPYRPEEMRVFPTLDHILTEAAAGELAGRQKIIIVPEELKSLVEKLILLRWSTNDASAGSWNHRNRKLSLHRISGAHNNSQSVIQDNFRAMRGASHSRNAVLLSDLETVSTIGRPIQPGGGFRIRDPIRSSRGYLIENEARLPNADGGADGAEVDDDDVDDFMSISAELNSVIEEIDTLNDRIGNLERRQRLAVPKNSKDDFRVEIQKANAELVRLKSLRETLEERVSELEDEQNGEVSKDPGENIRRVNDKSAYPHLMWWIASEGQAVQPRKRADWSLKTAVDRSVATILIGTEEELERLRGDLAFESRFFNLDDQFEIVHLESPDEQTKVALVEQLFNRPEVSSLGIQFRLKEDNGREPRSQLIYHFINRIDQMAYDQKIEKTAAFIRAYIALKNSLSEDLDLRRAREINEKFLERLFTKVFPMPLNPEILEPNDPLIRLRNQDQAVRDLQAAGYEGSQDLKRRFFDTILSQTRPTDSSRPIPNSQIIYGSTSTGKTYLLRMLFKMLDLTEYRHGGVNEDADYIFINVAKLTDDESNEPDKIAVKEAIADILDLLSQPKGARAHIVFDDFHKAATKGVREKLSQFIAGIFETPNGMLAVRSRDGKRQREIPVQNLNLYLTLNPTSNEAVRRQYVKDGQRGSELLKREVLAALSGDGFTPEESFLARWAEIINLDNFPRSAKVPELVKRVRANAGQGGQMILVDPLVIDTLIDRYPVAHARELLSPATAALTSLPSSAQKAPLYLVSVRRDGSVEGNETADLDKGVSQQELQSAVRGITQIDPIHPGDPVGLVHLMGFMMRNFRLQVYNHVALEAHLTDILRVDIPGQSGILKTNMLLGLATHILDKPRIPNSEINIRPEQYSFLSRAQLEELIKMQALTRQIEPYFPINLERMDHPEDLDLGRFITGTSTPSVEPKSRRAVLVEAVGRLETLLNKAMQLYLRLENTGELKQIGGWNEAQIQHWYQNLPSGDPEAEFAKVSEEILNEFFEFRDRLHSPDLLDFSGGQQPVPLNLYDEVRLFAFAMDKAILRLPWGQIANFTLRVSDLSSDFSLGTRASFRDYVGVHQLSAFSIATPEFMNDMLSTASSGTGRQMAEKVPSLKAHFGKVCESLLSGVKARGE